ncbi:MAG: kelch repeat-containing protein, partial [Polyangiaceae bacterium]
KLEIAGPSARARHSVALDPASGQAVLVGGRFRAGDAGAYTNYNDVWAFDFSAKTWTLLETTGAGPSERSNSATAVVNGKLVVFGGNVSTSGLTFTPKKDVFVLDLATRVWTEVAAAGGPPARLFHAMAAHPTKNEVFVFSGGDANAFTGPFLTDTWALDLDTATWTKLGSDTPDGTGRIKLGMWATIPDSGTEPMLYVFGGHDDGQLGNRNDVLSAFAGGGAVEFAPVREGDTFNNPSSGQCDFPVDFTAIDKESPERRSAFAFGQLPDGSAAVVFGGDSDCGRLSDAHWFDTRTGGWTAIRATLPGLVCERTGSTTCTSLCN